MKGLFIAFEGLDSVGKTEQMNLLHNSLEQTHHTCYEISGFSKSPVGDAVRTLRDSDWFMRLGEGHSFAEYLLFLSEHSYRTTSEISEKRDEGNIVIKDRYFLTVLAYQSFYYSQERKKASSDLHSVSFDIFNLGFCIPDLTVVQYANLEELYDRIEEKDKRKLPHEEKKVLCGVQNVFLNLQTEYTSYVHAQGKEVLYFNSTSLPAKEIHEKIKINLEKRL